MMGFLDRHSQDVLGLQRIIAALLFLEHGLMKLFHFPVPQPGAPDPLPVLLWVAAIIEIVGGSLLLVGFHSRVAAFLCSGLMAAGYFIAHAPKSFWPGANGGDAAILFSFLFLYITFAGPGSWSVDRSRR